MTAIAAAKIVACACSTVIAIAEDGTEIRTGCHATTKRTFAPGHDARLKGFLIRAGAENMMVRFEDSGINLTALGLAASFGFSHMVEDGIRAAKDRAFAKALRETKKAKPAPKAEPVKVAAKVGRWVYEGTISANGEIFSYTDRQGRHLMATKFTRV